jgi:hypothetical protein
MKLYSDYSAQRARQITFDLFAALNIGLWVWLGWWLYSLVMKLQAFGRQMEQAGAGFRGTMTNIGDDLGGIWVIGGSIRSPFDQASRAGGVLESAGQSQQEAVHNLALGLGIGIAVLPVLTILIFWLVPRIRFALKASKAKAMLSHENSRDLLALRALCSQKLSALAKIDDDPAGAWRREDEKVLRALASLELKSAGVRLA